jgi:hypothetical protein
MSTRSSTSDALRSKSIKLGNPRLVVTTGISIAAALLLAVPLMTVGADARGGGGHGGGGHGGGGFGGGRMGGGHIGGLAGRGFGGHIGGMGRGGVGFAGHSVGGPRFASPGPRSVGGNRASPDAPASRPRGSLAAATASRPPPRTPSARSRRMAA